VKNNHDYTISNAHPDAAEEIYRFFRANPEPGIRQVALDEIAALIDRGCFYVARDARGAIVGTVYLQSAYSDDGTEVEFGGGLVARAHRDGGLAYALADCALAAHMVAAYRTPNGAPPALRVVGRVLQSNRAPVALLKRLGFEFRQHTRIEAAQKPGLQNMEQDADGRIAIDEYEFSGAHLGNCVDRVRALRDGGVLRGKHGQQRTVGIDVFALRRHNGFDPLDGFPPAA
jgi:RimJ/RimL family protein N-acetyltransferase